MEGPVEMELCGNCKKEIPHHNYVMHTAHCARNISLCPMCKEPFPKSQIEGHKQKCTPKIQVVKQPLANIESSSYFQKQKSIEDEKAAKRRAKKMERMKFLVDSGETLGHSNSTQAKMECANWQLPKVEKPKESQSEPQKPPSLQDNINFYKNKSMLPCKYCELELPKLDLEEHENYCGARTEKCTECGELVMFKYKDLHYNTNHSFLKLNDEPGPRTWDNAVLTSNAAEPPKRRVRPPRFNLEDYINPSFTASVSTPIVKTEKLESSKEISRRLDCKTEYIRNLLHDSASITVPLRSTGTVPRNHFNHNKGPAPQPPRKRNPPTELVIPCEFCNVPIPHEDLIQHETGCRPDLTRYNPRRRSASPDFVQYPAPGSPEADLPCEFCADLIPASQLLRHQATCN